MPTSESRLGLVRAKVLSLEWPGGEKRGMREEKKSALQMSITAMIRKKA